MACNSAIAIGLLLWGGAAFAIVPPVQMRVMEAASEAPGLASSINVGAFNLGNALGAAVGKATYQRRCSRSIRSNITSR